MVVKTSGVQTCSANGALSTKVYSRGSPKSSGLSKRFLSSRLMMNSRQLCNSHQRHKLLWAKASRDILKIRVLEMAFPGVFKRCFPLRTPCCFVRIHASLETMPSQAFQDIKQFKHSTGLNLLEYVFNVIQNWETDALQFYSMVLIFR